MKRLIFNVKTLAFCFLLGFSAFSHSSLIVTIDDKNYNITTFVSTIDDALPLLQQQLWWDNSDLAEALASEAEMLYTFFAYDYYYLPPPYGWELSVIYYVGDTTTGYGTSDPNLQRAHAINYIWQGVDYTTHEREFAILSEVTVSSPNTLSLFGLIAIALVCFKRRTR